MLPTDEPANDSVPEGTVRLVGGSTPAEGRVEVYHLGIWGTVCSDGWDLLDARVVCLQLGYTTATQTTVPGGGTGQIWYDDVACIGSETSLVDCRSNGLATHNCFHFLDAGVVCASELGKGRGSKCPLNLWTLASVLELYSICMDTWMMLYG